jgi:CDP-diacylglycerol--serine O-phosphatidyltransferase
VDSIASFAASLELIEVDMSKTDETKLHLSRGIYLIPNLFTIGAMFAGFYAIVAAMRGRFEYAAIAIFIAMIMDGLDGRIARLTHTQSEFGAQLDSLSDLVSFGVAPALVMYTWSLSVMGKPGWLAAFVYVVCTALRLARFNTQLDSPDKRYFQGLATPAAAALVASIVWVCSISDISGASIALPMTITAVALGLMKVSNIRYRSFKDFDLRDSVPFVVILAVVLVIVLISFDPPDILLVTSLLYVLSGPVGSLYALCRRKVDKKKAKKSK